MNTNLEQIHSSIEAPIIIQFIFLVLYLPTEQYGVCINYGAKRFYKRDTIRVQFHTTTTFLLILLVVLFSVPATFISLQTSDRFLGNLTRGLFFETVKV
jgi:hypothetical protein